MQKLQNFILSKILKRVEANEVSAGDIGAIAGFEDVDIGDTLASPKNPEPLPFVAIDEPTITMNFMVNNSPFAGLEGKYVTTRNISERLIKRIKIKCSLKS